MKKVLVCRTDGIGDLLLTTPLMHELALAGNEVYVLAGLYAGTLLENNPDVKGIIYYNKENIKFVQKSVKERGFDAAVCAYPRYEIAAMLKKCGIREIYGTSRRWYSPLFFSKRVNISRKKSENHEADYNLMLAPFIGNKKASGYFYFPTEEEKSRAADIIKKLGLNERFVIVHPGSKGSAWNLSPEKYAEIASVTAAETGADVLITGAASEKEIMAKAAAGSAADKRIKVLDESLAVRDFAALIGMSSLVVSCSTGPMHIAAAQKVKTFSFFPPKEIRHISAVRWGALGNKSVIMELNPDGETPDMDKIKAAIKSLLEL
ncbi:MAG TPA: glycosyltransferase family 9 protein [Candidatus Goldiibacteriota bacterium]|nr:glycosyltransferase family 9 protein [Candidatus Goldiibacteriota bacterium]HRQ44197.1 glycosyltransferase family 9 protein [Candidatus Goldiibacteriota bacterium]